jgi:phosphoglycolate phosphatase
VNIVFDLDGTLIHSAPDIAAAANATLDDRGAPPLRLEDVVSFIGNGTKVLVEKILNARGIDQGEHHAFHAAFMERYEGALALTDFYPGVTAALDRFAAAGHRLGLCTNKPIVPTRAVLRHFELTETFASVVGGDSLPQRKPDAAPLRHVIGELGAGPTLYVGDSEVDGATAKAAGVPFALFSQGYRNAAPHEIPHTHLFDHFEDLVEIVEGYSVRP